MLAERLSPAQRPHPLPLSLPEDRGQRCSFAILLAQFKVSRLLFSSMISSIHHVVLDIWLFAQAKKKKKYFYNSEYSRDQFGDAKHASMGGDK